MKPSEDILRKLPKKFRIGWTQQGVQVDFVNELSGVVLAMSAVESAKESHIRAKARKNLQKIVGKIHTYSEYWKEQLKDVLPQIMRNEILAENISPAPTVHQLDALILELREHAQAQKIDQHIIGTMRLLLWKIVCVVHGDENAQLLGFQSVIGVPTEEIQKD